MKRLALLLLALVLLPLSTLSEIELVDSTYTIEETAPPADAQAPIAGDEATIAPASGEGGVFSSFVQGGLPPGTEGTPAPQSPIATQAPRAMGEDPWPRTIVVSLGGDCTIGCNDYQRTQPEGFSSVIKEKGYAWPFSELLPLFAQDDLTLVNFEGTLTESRDKLDKQFNFKGPAAYGEILTLGSVEAVNLANNHTMDYGDEGLQDTLSALAAHGIVYSQQGEPAIYETRGVKIGLIGNTFAYKNGKRDISAHVKALREAGCHIIIASFHWGSEYSFEFTRDQRNIGRAAIDAGADIIVGHHPHVIQGIEKYKDTYILYSLGNLVFGGNMDPDHKDTYVAQATFTVHENGEVEGPILKILPARLTSKKSGTDYRPVFAEGEEYERILKNILGRSSNMGDFTNPQ